MIGAAVSVQRFGYYKDYSGIRIVPDSFLFQEGKAEFYRSAKYGEFKFDDAGHSVLVGLADDKLQIIKPN